MRFLTPNQEMMVSFIHEGRLVINIQLQHPFLPKAAAGVDVEVVLSMVPTMVRFIDTQMAEYFE